MIIGIYKLQINNNFYVGQSTNIKERFRQHKNDLRNRTHENPRVQHAYDKYGNLTYEIILICAPENLDLYEQRCLDAWYGTENCMNINPLAAKPPSNKGKKLGPRSEETKRKLSEAHKGQTPWNKGVPASKEQRAKLSEAFKGKKHSDESKKKMSESHRGNTNWLGKKMSEEHKKKIGEQSKGNTNLLGKKFSDESKKKMSDAAKRAWIKRRGEVL